MCQKLCIRLNRKLKLPNANSKNIIFGLYTHKTNRYIFYVTYDVIGSNTCIKKGSKFPAVAAMRKTSGEVVSGKRPLLKNYDFLFFLDGRAICGPIRIVSEHNNGIIVLSCNTGRARSNSVHPFDDYFARDCVYLFIF